MQSLLSSLSKHLVMPHDLIKNISSYRIPPSKPYNSLNEHERQTIEKYYNITTGDVNIDIKYGGYFSEDYKAKRRRIHLSKFVPLKNESKFLHLPSLVNRVEMIYHKEYTSVNTPNLDSDYHISEIYHDGLTIYNDKFYIALSVGGYYMLILVSESPSYDMSIYYANSLEDIYLYVAPLFYHVKDKIKSICPFVDSNDYGFKCISINELKMKKQSLYDEFVSSLKSKGFISDVENDGNMIDKCSGVNGDKCNGLDSDKCSGLDSDKCNGLDSDKCNCVNGDKGNISDKKIQTTDIKQNIDLKSVSIYGEYLSDKAELGHIFKLKDGSWLDYRCKLNKIYIESFPSLYALFVGDASIYTSFITFQYTVLMTGEFGI